MKQTILVIGATGRQGGSVARYLKQDGTYNVLCMVRNTESDNSKRLTADGYSLVQGDLVDTVSLTKAMNGCYGVFAVTNFWDPAVGYDGEIQQGLNIADAAKAAGVKHLVFSTLDGNAETPHFDSKFKVEQYMKSLGLPLTSLVTSFYYENFDFFMKPAIVDGVVVFSVAQESTTRVPMYSVGETGRFVLEAFKNPDKYIGNDICAIGEYIDYPTLVKTYQEVTGQQARFEEIPMSAFRAMPGTAEIAANLQFFNDLSNGLKENRRSGTTPSGSTWREYLLSSNWSATKRQFDYNL